MLKKVANGNNLDASVTFPAVPGKRYQIVALSFSYSGTVTTGAYEIEGLDLIVTGDGTNTKVVHSLPTGFTLVAPYPFVGKPNTDLKVTVKASGAAGSIGRVTAAAQLIDA